MKTITIDGEWEYITSEEYENTTSQKMKILTPLGLNSNSISYLKRAEKQKPQEFPIVFEDKSYRIEVEDDRIDIYNMYKRASFPFYDSLPLLIQAVKKAEEIFNKEKKE